MRWADLRPSPHSWKRRPLTPKLTRSYCPPREYFVGSEHYNTSFHIDTLPKTAASGIAAYETADGADRL